MPQHVLAVAGAEAQPAQQMNHLGMQVRHVGLLGRFLAELLDVLLHLGLRFGHQLLDPRGMDPAVGDQLVQRHAGHLAADRIEAADDHHARRVVDDHVDAGGFFERPDVASFAADDPALHLVAGNVDGAGGRFGGVCGGVALDAGQQGVAGFGVADFGQLLLVAHDQGALLVLQIVLETVEQPLGGFFARQPAELVQRLPLEVDLLRQFFVAAVGVFDFFGQLALVAFDHPLLTAKLLGLLVEGVLALVEQPFALVQFLPEPGQLAFALGLLLDGALFDPQLGLLDEIGAVALEPG